jgi:hypothetical protein
MSSFYMACPLLMEAVFILERLFHRNCCKFIQKMILIPVHYNFKIEGWKYF